MNSPLVARFVLLGMLGALSAKLWYEQVTRFTWDECATQMVGLYRSLAGMPA